VRKDLRICLGRRREGSRYLDGGKRKRGRGVKSFFDVTGETGKGKWDRVFRLIGQSNIESPGILGDGSPLKERI